MRIAIIQFPGSNCERETSLAVIRAGMEAVPFLWNQSSEILTEVDGYIIVGGFSYEDRSRSGIIAALDPVIIELKIQAALGKPILGICNGAQILVETGLVPGLENHKIAMALTENKRVMQTIDPNGIPQEKIVGTGFYNAWIHMKLSTHYQRNAFTMHINPSHIFKVPIAHAEGRFVMTAALLAEIKMQGLNVFQYCNAAGEILPYFPTNPNGSVDNIAAISNKAGNVMAIMPHPERTTNGDLIFQSMKQYIVQQKTAFTYHPTSLHYYPRPIHLRHFQQEKDRTLWMVRLIITDNHAITVQNTLKQLGIMVNVTRVLHWEIAADALSLAALKKSGMLFNPKKESLIEVAQDFNKQDSHNHHFAILVRAKEDIYAQEKLQMIHKHFHLPNVKLLRYGVLWQFDVPHSVTSVSEIKNHILKTNIIFNPYSHDGYDYVY